MNRAIIWATTFVVLSAIWSQQAFSQEYEAGCGLSLQSSGLTVPPPDLCSTGPYGGLSVTVTASPASTNASGNLFLRCTSGSRQIDEITIYTPFTGGYVILNLQEAGGTVSRLFTIRKIGTGTLILGTINISGSIGQQGISSTIVAQQISSIRSQGSIYSSITTTGSSDYSGVIV